jgi:Flp pilus assembly protein TadD
MTSTRLRAARTAPALAITALVLLATGCQSGQEKEKEKDWFEGGPMQLASPDTMQLTARVLAAKGKTEQAGFLIERMYQRYPDNLGTYSEGAEVLLIEGRITDAIQWIDRGLVRFPENPVLLNNRGLCHLLDADLAAADKDFRAAYAKDPSDADYVSNLALTRALSGDEKEARQLWERVVPQADVDANMKLAIAARPKFTKTK